LRHSVDAAYCYGRSSVVCLLVGLSVMTMSPAKTAEPIEIQFGIWTRVDQRNYVCYVCRPRWSPDHPWEEVLLRGMMSEFSNTLSGPDIGIFPHAVDQRSDWPAA